MLYVFFKLFFVFVFCTVFTAGKLSNILSATSLRDCDFGNKELSSNVLDSKWRQLQTMYVFAPHSLLLWGGVN